MDVSWTGKKAEGRRIDAFELWCWRRLLRVPWIARRFNQSILKEISPEYSLGVQSICFSVWVLVDCLFTDLICFISFIICPLTYLQSVVMIPLFVGNLCLHSLFFFLSLAIHLLILSIFSKNSFGVFFPSIFLSSVLLMFALILFFFSLLALRVIIIIIDVQIVSDGVSGNFLGWLFCHFDLTWLVTECFLPVEDVCLCFNVYILCLNLEHFIFVEN